MQTHEPQNHQQLHVVFLPYPTPGHMNPMVDTARLFARHGAAATIIATQANALTFQNAIDSDFSSGHPIRTHVLQFPASQCGLPEGVENFKSATSEEMQRKLGIGMRILENQIKALIQDLQPDCLVTDMFYPWTVESAAKLGIPRLYFYSASYFSNCVRYSIRKHKPHEGLVSDTHKFTIPDFPHDNIQITALQLEEWVRSEENALAQYFKPVWESERKSYGALYNSFHELEGDYEQLYKSNIGIKAWSVGPVSAWVNKDDEKTNKGHNNKHTAEEVEWLNWLNSRQDNSVLYVNFGSLTRLPYAQLVEIAHGLENSGHNFIWVIRNKDKDDEGDNFLQDFEHRMKESNKGCIIWNWAPQLLILDHPAIGGIVTHCGWNSILEGLNAGLPMITWPIFAEQFYNERLLVDVLKIGVPVGVKENKLWMSLGEKDVVRREEIMKAVVMFMGSDEEIREMRSRAKKLGDAGKRTIEEGGSSYNNLIQLIEELKSLKVSRALDKTKLEK